MKATILLPTTADRGALLEYSAGSVLRQTVEELELFIIGDGVNEETRLAVDALLEKDSRVRFFSFEKHPRRGEPYRHKVLQEESTGEIVCYLCDRDLMLSNHVSEMYQHLQTHDIVSTLSYHVRASGKIEIARVRSLGELTGKRRTMGRLSSVGHTMRAYRSLPHGWRTTPEGEYTDTHMWRQFLDLAETRASIVPTPTILYFKRGGHPGWPTRQRAKELAKWYARLTAEEGEPRIHGQCLSHIIRENIDLRDRVNSQACLLNEWITVKGKSPRLFLKRILGK